jgi:hypothetical protein
VKSSISPFPVPSYRFSSLDGSSTCVEYFYKNEKNLRKFSKRGSKILAAPLGTPFSSSSVGALAAYAALAASAALASSAALVSSAALAASAAWAASAALAASIAFCPPLPPLWAPLCWTFEQPPAPLPRWPADS